MAQGGGREKKRAWSGNKYRSLQENTRHLSRRPILRGEAGYVFAEGWQTNAGEIGVVPPPEHLFSVTLMRGRGIAAGEGVR